MWKAHLIPWALAARTLVPQALPSHLGRRELAVTLTSLLAGCRLAVGGNYPVFCTPNRKSMLPPKLKRPWSPRNPTVSRLLHPQSSFQLLMLLVGYSLMVESSCFFLSGSL